MKLLILGSSGLVGQHLLQLALADGRVTQVVAPVRRAPPAHAKLLAPVVDFDALPADAPWWRADAVVCALGTTMNVAKSEAAFRKVDHEYPLAAARLALAAGTPVYVLNSAFSANLASSVFYNRVKGEVERDLEALGFASLTHVRPGLIGGERATLRTGEWAATQVLKVLGPVLPKRWRINPAPTIAAALLAAGFSARPGVHIVQSDQLI